MNVVLYSALYRDNRGGKCLKAGVAFRLKFKVDDKSFEKDFETISTDRTYGDLWLSELLKMLDRLDGTEATLIKLITNQIDAGKMATKIERILIEALEKKKTTESEIEQLVYKDGRHTPRPNNQLYTKIVVKLVEMAKNHCFFSQEHLPSVHTMDLVKSLHQQIAPHKALIEKKKSKPPAKKKAPL